MPVVYFNLGKEVDVDGNEGLGGSRENRFCRRKKGKYKGLEML